MSYDPTVIINIQRDIEQSDLTLAQIAEKHNVTVTNVVVAFEELVMREFDYED